MSTPTMTRDLAWAAAQDAANVQMRAAGRSKWSPEDYALAVREFDRLWPEERDYTPARLAAVEQIHQDAVGLLRHVTRLPYQYAHHIDGDPNNNDLDNLEIRTGYADVDPESKGREHEPRERRDVFDDYEGCNSGIDTAPALAPAVRRVVDLELPCVDLSNLGQGRGLAEMDRLCARHPDLLIGFLFTQEAVAAVRG